MNYKTYRLGLRNKIRITVPWPFSGNGHPVKRTIDKDLYIALLETGAIDFHMHGNSICYYTRKGWFRKQHSVNTFHGLLKAGASMRRNYVNAVVRGRHITKKRGQPKKD